MQARCVLLILIYPILLEGCCNTYTYHQKKRAGSQRETTHQHYRVVEGESFMMPCDASLWFRTTEAGELKDSSLNCGEMFQARVNHSGKYTSALLPPLVIYLQVVEKNTLGCSQAEEHSVILHVAKGGHITCPGFNCSDNTDVIWHKRDQLVSEQKRTHCEEGGRLELCEVTEYDEDLYFCDRQIVVEGVAWTFRRTVEVMVIRHRTSIDPPRIEYPNVNIEEVELGQPHTLKCQVYFQIEKNFSPQVKWYLNHGGNMENMILLPMKTQKKKVSVEEMEVIQRAIIKEVTPQHLNHMYTCIASTPVQKSNVTIQLTKKTKVKLPVLVGYPIVSFLLIAGLGIILHVKWLELQLIYRSHFQCGKHDEENKEFDVLLSYVWNPLSEEIRIGSTISCRSATFSSEEACLSMDLVNTEEDEVTQTPLQVLLPLVIEGQWGYRLCLLERDVLPGGAYTNDVALAIKRSRMLICILSTDYLTDSNAVFVLETGVKALLQNSVPKLLLVWTSATSAALIQPDPPLPVLVQRALKVLPSLDWSSCKPARATSKFWRSLKREE